jgi:hypothetical protein
MSIATRLFARCGEPVNLETRADTASGGIVVEAYTAFATGILAKVVEVGTAYAGGNEQIEEGATHIITISNFPQAEGAQYVYFGDRRMRVLRQRYIGPPDIRFCQFLCEEIERA